MDDTDYAAFSHLAGSLHFGRSARSLGMSPSALSRRVQTIEEELGSRLFERTRQKVTLTRAGEVFLRFARQRQAELDELKHRLLEEAASPTGELVIACTVTACHTILPTLLARFRRTFPRVTLRLFTQDATRSLSQLQDGEVDLAVIPAEPGGPVGLDSQVIGHTEFAFIAPRDTPEFDALLLADPPVLGSLPWVAPLGGVERTRLLSWLEARGNSPRIVAEVRGNEGIIAMVTLGSGVALVPELVLRSSPLKDQVRTIDGVELPPGYDVALCQRPESRARHLVRAFWELSAR
jgi:LysR family positive regulator for ilvC